MFTQLFVQTQTKENIKAPRHWPLWGEFAGARLRLKSPAFIVYSTFYSGADQRMHKSSASLAFVKGIHRWPVNSPQKGPVTRKRFPFDDVILRHPPITIFHHDIKSMENAFWFHPYCIKRLLRTFVDSMTVGAIFHSDMRACGGVTSKPNFHRVWITMEMSSVKWGRWKSSKPG